MAWVGEATGGRLPRVNHTCHEESPNMPTTRRIITAALAVAGLAAVAAPVASADVVNVKTSVSVAPGYNPAALTKTLNGKWNVDEGLGPVMLKVHHTITCKKGKVRRAGYPAMCQWSSTTLGVGGTYLTSQSDPNADAWINPINGRPAGDAFHAGYMRVGGVQTDDWAVTIRNDSFTETQKELDFAVHAADGGSVTREVWIYDDEIRRGP
jgi:hypothetical protein